MPTSETPFEQALADLRSVADPSRRPGMARVGINVDRALGVSIPDLRKIGRRYRTDHVLALALWGTEIHEARILASMVDDLVEVTKAQMEDWVEDFDSWDLCDQVCSNLFDSTPFAKAKAREWARRPEEYVKRAGFTLIAAFAARDHASPDAAFTVWFPVIRREASDERNYVKKAVNWALRGIGKRNLALNAAAIAEAEVLAASEHPSARWIARDAMRELRSEAVQARLRTGL